MVSTHSSRNLGPAGRLLHRFSLGRKREFRRILRNRPDLVVISQGDNNSGLDWMSFCQQADLPFVVIVQCNTEAWWPGDVVTGDLARAYCAARKVYCVSQNNLEMLEHQIGEPLSNGLVVRNPYNVSPERPPPWPAETAGWRLACVARLDPKAKGQDLLFQVLSRPRWQERSVEVNLYGTGPCEGNLRRLAEHLKLKMVRFRGHVSNITAIWEQNHLLLLPSRAEGLPLALVEAMWCGRPAVVTDIGGNCELCVDGETGFVAAAPSVALLEQTMEVAWARRGEWQRMGNAALSHVAQLISTDPIGDFSRQLSESASARPTGNLQFS